MTIGNNTQAQIKSVVERIEALETQKSEIAEEIKEIYEEVKSSLDVKALREAIRRRKKNAAELAEREARIEQYMDALSDTPLGRAAAARAIA
jgi:uncharacterized protein (UPF0335 family)